jgi:hypothetical protein
MYAITGITGKVGGELARTLGVLQLGTSLFQLCPRLCDRLWMQ